MRTRTIVLLAYEGCQVLDVTGPAEVFSVAGAMDEGAYRIVIASLHGDDVVTSSGVRIGVETALSDFAGPIDTLVVPGGFTWPQAMSVCAGAFLHGAVGLLEGRRAARPRRRPVPRGVHAAAGRPAAVQRPPARRSRRPVADARAAGRHRGGPCGRSPPGHAQRARRLHRAPPHAPVRARSRHHAGALRRAGARRGRAGAARDVRRAA